MACVLAKYAGQFIGNVDLESSDSRPVIMEYFRRQCITIQWKNKYVLFCIPALKQTQDNAGSVWCAYLFDTLSQPPFIQLCIQSKFVDGFEKNRNENVLLVLPLE